MHKELGEHLVTDRQTIRQSIRHARRQLSQAEQHNAAQQLVSQVASKPHLAQAQAVALYLANDGELDPLPLIHWYWAQGRQVCLPVLHPFSPGQLLFFRYQPDTAMHTNVLGITEPVLDIRLLVPKNALDIIYTPLVAFDAQGNRLGMGGGFYDRTLANAAESQVVERHVATPNGTNARSRSSIKPTQGPRAVGLAHDCQQVSALPIASWDVPLAELITPSQHFSW